MFSVKTLAKSLFFSLVVVLLLVMHGGIWIMPNLGAQFLVSQNLSSIPFADPQAHYLMTNYLQPAVFALLGGSSFTGYVAYSTGLAIAFIAIFIYWFVVFHGEKVAIKDLKLWVAISFPVFTLPFYWVGMDAMTLLLMLMVLISLSTRWCYLFGFLLGLQHFDQGILGFALLIASIILFRFIEEKEHDPTVLRLIGVLFAIVMGKLFLHAVFWQLGIVLQGDRSQYLIQHMNLFVGYWSNVWPMLLWSIFGVGWLFLLRFYLFFWPLIAVAAIVFFLLMFVGDQTRVGVIVLFPALFYWLLSNKKFFHALSKRIVIGYIIMFLVLPPVVIWGGVHYSLFQYDLELINSWNADSNLQETDFLKPFK